LDTYLLTQFLGHAKRLEWSEASDTRSPVGVLAVARRRPIPGHEFANAPRDHTLIVSPQTDTRARFVKYLGALDASTMSAVGRRLVLALGLEDCL